MSSSYESPLPAVGPQQLGRPYWLPPFGRGNGLDALFWTPVAELPERHLDIVLQALRAADIPGWVAEAHHGQVRGRTAASGRVWDLWVATVQYDAAQDVLMRAMASSTPRRR